MSSTSFIKFPLPAGREITILIMLKYVATSGATLFRGTAFQRGRSQNINILILICYSFVLKL